MPVSALSQESLKEVLEYVPATGLFTWKKSTARRTQVGSCAGYIKKQTGYLLICVLGERHYAHRLAFLYMTGTLPGADVDHINGLRHDNSWCNLREVARAENLRNRKLPSTNTSGVIGVCWSALRKRWVATISVNNKNTVVGAFTEFTDAVVARKLAEQQHGYHSNHGRLV
ncbi:MAG: pathogenesis-related transcriptional factor and ERF protein [uncultured bacterium]|nr:MAG: pathogenesis-related transcriptional factor and ERF protein [uncultured bacterium]